MFKILYSSCLGLYPAFFVAIHAGNVRYSQKLRKNSPKPLLFGDSRSFKVIDVNKTKNPTTSA